ncbi:hypothetical protein FQZ97_1093870 [compost metagenome]
MVQPDVAGLVVGGAESGGDEHLAVCQYRCLGARKYHRAAHLQCCLHDVHGALLRTAPAAHRSGALDAGSVGRRRHARGAARLPDRRAQHADGGTGVQFLRDVPRISLLCRAQWSHRSSHPLVLHCNFPCRRGTRPAELSWHPQGQPLLRGPHFAVPDDRHGAGAGLALRRQPAPH